MKEVIAIKPRVFSKTGIYHVVLRGVNRQIIFEDREDREYFLFTIKKMKERSDFKVIAFCIMSNHIHLLLLTQNESISKVMQRIESKYVGWYNRKYERIGHLFQGRYGSEPIEDEARLLEAVRYIHNNPVKAGLCKYASQYGDSSYDHYRRDSDIVDTEILLNYIDANDFAKFHARSDDEEFIDDHEYRALYEPDKKAIVTVLREAACTTLHEFRQLERKARDKVIALSVSLYNIPVRQMSRITGISRAVINNIVNQEKRFCAA